MVFEEKKVKEGYEYKTEQFVGLFTFKSDRKIVPNILDSLVLLLSSKPSTEGVTEYKGQKIHYVFVKKDMWEEDDEEELQN